MLFSNLNEEQKKINAHNSIVHLRLSFRSAVSITVQTIMCFRICQMHSHLHYACCALLGLCWPSQLFVPSQTANPLKSTEALLWQSRGSLLYTCSYAFGKRRALLKETVFCACPRSCFLVQSVSFTCISTVYPWAAAQNSSQSSFFLMI